MFRPSEAGRASGKVRDIVSTSIPNSGEIDNFNFISVVVGATTEQIVDLDVPVGNLKLMHVPDGLANFNEDDPGDIRYVICLVLVGDIIDYSRTPDILLLLFDPQHDLPQGPQLIHRVDAVTTIQDFVAFGDVLVLQTLYYVQLVVQHVHAVRELPVCCKKALLLQSHYAADLQSEVVFALLYLEDAAEGSSAQFLADLVIVDHFVAVRIYPLLDIVDFSRDDGDFRICAFPEGRSVEEFRHVEVIQLFLHFMLFVGRLVCRRVVVGFFVHLAAVQKYYSLAQERPK
jgi:hypothetical protein